MNNPKIVSPEKTGKNHFQYAEDIKQPKSRKLDDHHVAQQERHTGGYNCIFNEYLEFISLLKVVQQLKDKLTSKSLLWLDY